MPVTVRERALESQPAYPETNPRGRRMLLMEGSPSLGGSEVRLEGFEQPLSDPGRGNAMDGL